MTTTVEYLTVPQVAEKIQVSVATVNRMIKDNKIKSMKFGRARRIHVSEISVEAQSKGEG